MTSEAQVLLAVLAPVGTALLALGAKLLDRHLKMIDKIESTNGRTAEVLAAIVARLERIERAIGIEDKLDEIHRHVSSPDLRDTGRHQVVGAAPVPAPRSSSPAMLRAPKGPPR